MCFVYKMSSHKKSLKGKGIKGKRPKPKQALLSYTPTLNSHLSDSDFKSSFRQSFVEHSQFTSDSGVELTTFPFNVAVVPDLIQENHFLEGLREELSDLIFIEKNNDLYKFHQTDDFKEINKPHVNTLRQVLKSQLLPWLREVTGIDLNERVDITSSRYEYTDTLLCHDDELDSRRIAFVLYLVPPWKPEDGGALDLFDMDEHLQPRNIVKSILPRNNQLVWFEVTEASHHQVAEVLTEDKVRLSVNGWFHATPESRPARYVKPREPLVNYEHLEEETFFDWINPMYLSPILQAEVQEKFESESEIQLQEFLNEEKYLALQVALEDEKLKWKRQGPPNKRQYDRVLIDEETPTVIREFLALLRSEPFFLTLSNLTGLSLHTLAASDETDGQGTSQDSADDIRNRQGTSLDITDDSKNKQDASLDEKESNGVGTSQNIDMIRGKQESGSNSAACASGSSLKTKNTDSKNEEDNQFCEVSSSKNESNAESDEIMETNSEDAENCCDKDKEQLEDPEENHLSKKRRLNSCSIADEERGDREGGRCRVELRRWKHGDYTLLHDTDSEGAEYALDLMFYCSCPDWDQECGGFTSYIARGEDEELLTVVPAENCLALVYRDKDTLRFVKHLNSRMRSCVVRQQNGQRFYDFSAVYFE